MQVHCDEGVAIRIGPEPCAGIREDVGEASAGERVGQPLSREINLVPGADAVCWAEGHAGGRAIASVRADPARSKTLACMDALCRKPGDLQLDRGRLSCVHGPHREGEEP